MRAKIYFLGLSVAVVGAALWLAFQERTKRLTIERDLATAEVRRGAQEAELRRTEQRLAAAGEEPRARSATAAALPAPAPVAKTDAPRPAPSPAVVLRDAMLHDPHLQNLQFAVMHSRLTATYQPLCDRLKLSPAQATEFLALLRKRQEQEADLAAVVETQRLASTDPTVGKLRQQAADEFRAAQSALLGEVGRSEFEAYERTVPVREMVNETAGALTLMGPGLNATQADALLGVLVNASPAYRQGGMATARNIDWDQALAGAMTVLSPAQFDAFKNSVVQVRNMDRMRELAARK
jgi:hypothetical protein